MAEVTLWKHIFYLTWNLYILYTSHLVQADDIRVTIDQNKQQGDYIQLLAPLPRSLHQGDKVTVIYRCHDDARIGLELRLWTSRQEDFRMFIKTWMCKGHTNSELRRTVKIHLPENLAYRPSETNRHSIYAEKTMFWLWMMDERVWQSKPSRIYDYALATYSHTVILPPPYERPEKEVMVCESWGRSLIQSSKPYTPSCPAENSVFRVIDFPVVLTGGWHGVHKKLQPYKNSVLEQQRIANFHQPKFTIAVWLYIIEYCPLDHLCSIVTHFTWDENFLTPIILINKQGHLHIQTHQQDLNSIAWLSLFTVPRKQWVRLMLAYSDHRWEATLNYGENWSKREYTHYDVPRQHMMYYDDTQGLHVFGGAEVKPSFKGYIGDAVIYRGQHKKDHEIAYPSPYHPMFELEVTLRNNKCEHFLRWVEHRIYQCHVLLQDLIAKRSCPNSILALYPPQQKQKSKTCALYKGPKQKEYDIVRRMIRRLVFSNKQVELKDIGKTIYEHAVDLIEEEGFSAISHMVVILKQASCYGNHDATFMLSAILNNGVAIKAQEALSHAYLMRGALDNNRLCLLALGNRLANGLDGMPFDREMAYSYYKNVADRTRQDREDHKNEDVLTEQVRLIDEDAMRQQTDENGDLFMWFKHQAAQGVVSAQKDLARLLHWGSQGITRNLKAAAEYYQVAAQSDDPVAHFDYGIVLLKGQGVEKNTTKAVKYLERAAQKKHPAALNTLGWHALEIEKDNAKAIGFFEEAYKLGNPDASHNLGHMYMTGKTPDGKPDKVKAWQYFSFAATRGQLDSELMVAVYNMRGHPLVQRNTELALLWARFTAEKNPAVGRFLSRALKSYRKHNWPSALLYYLITSETGTEVAHFNVAYLCEENQDGLVTQIEKDCIWRHYNLSASREPHMVPAYSLIKMGDFHWYGCEGNRDVKAAANYYSEAAVKGDPHAIFNLAFMVEEGATIEKSVLDKMRVPAEARANNVTLLVHLYSRCKEERNTEAHFPCLIALYKVQFYDLWEKHHILVKLSSCVGAMVTVAVTITSIYHYFRGNPLSVNNV